MPHLTATSLMVSRPRSLSFHILSPPVSQADSWVLAHAGAASGGRGPEDRQRTGGGSRGQQARGKLALPGCRGQAMALPFAFLVEEAPK